MIDRFVGFFFNNRFVAIMVFVALAALGYYSWQQLAIEAYPDIADVSSQVITLYPGHAAEEVEQQVTIPLERQLNGIPGLQVMRSNSTFGLSLITLVFRDGVEDYWARQRIQERIAQATLPPNITPGLDPLTSPVGEIYRYTLQSPIRNQRELRDIQNWIVIPQIKQVFGVADVSNFGGETTQFQIQLDPAKLAEFGVSLQQINTAIQANNANAGGGVLTQGEQSFVVRGVGIVKDLQDLGNIVVTEKNGTPVLLSSLGNLQYGALQRSGILGIDHNPDSVSGIVLLLRGENPSQVLEGIHQKVAELNSKILPSDVKIIPYLDRTELIDTTLHTVLKTLTEGFILVVLVLIFFLGGLEGAILVALTIPLSMLIAFTLMHLTHIPANLLSLGAIDFGIIVDGSIVLMETIIRKREKNPDNPLSQKDAQESALQVAQPIFFSKVIIITAYLPLFAFERVEKKLFSPMAYTVGYALVGAVLVALALIPPMAYLIYRKPRKVFRNFVLTSLENIYAKIVRGVLNRPALAIVPGLLAVGLTIILAATLGKEFLPYLDEGSMWMQIELPPGISLDKASEIANEFRNVAMQFPEVTHVVTQLGRNDDGTDPFTPSHIESAITLKPYGEWGGDKQALIARMSEKFKQIGGIDFGFSQPIIDGVNDKIAGAHSELVVKIYGNDFAKTRKLAEEVTDVLKSIPGAVDVGIDQEPPLPQLQINVDRQAAARYGINVSDISDLIQLAIGGQAVSQAFVADRVYDITIRFIESARNSPEAIANLTLTAPSGARIPLSEVATIKVSSGESVITREMNRRHLTVKLNLSERPLSAFLADAKKALDEKVHYDPTENQISWGGQFENQQRAQGRILIILPGVLLLIFLLLYLEFGTAQKAALILVHVPLGLLGGLLALHLRGMTLNVSSAVGFIALFGISVQNRVIMMANLNEWVKKGIDLKEAVFQGAIERFRPVLLTATVATLGLLPAALARGVGSDVQRPLATVIVGGLTSAVLFDLVVFPAAYYLMVRYNEKRAARNV